MVFKSVFDAVEAGYKDGQPLWMTSPKDSVFCILSKSEVDQKSAEEVQKILRGKHIMVYDQFEPTLRFDEEGLSTLGDLQKLVTIHGVYDFCVVFFNFLNPLNRLLQKKHIKSISPPAGHPS